MITTPPAAKPAHAADQGLIVGELAVTAKLDEILDQSGDIVDQVRPLRMSRDLRLLPGIEVGVGLGASLGNAAAQRRDLAVESIGGLALGQFRELLELGFEVGDRAARIPDSGWPSLGSASSEEAVV